MLGQVQAEAAKDRQGTPASSCSPRRPGQLPPPAPGRLHCPTPKRHQRRLAGSVAGHSTAGGASRDKEARGRAALRTSPCLQVQLLQQDVEEEEGGLHELRHGVGIGGAPGRGGRRGWAPASCIPESAAPPLQLHLGRCPGSLCPGPPSLSPPLPPLLHLTLSGQARLGLHPAPTPCACPRPPAPAHLTPRPSTETSA